MFLTHAENSRSFGDDPLVQAFTTTEIHLDQPFFICTRIQFFSDQWVRTTALLLFEDDLREIVDEEEDQSRLVDLMILMPCGLGWKVWNINDFWDEFSSACGKNILVFKDDSGRLKTFRHNTEIPLLTKLPIWSKVEKFSRLRNITLI
jgi:hypothetical protein